MGPPNAVTKQVHRHLRLLAPLPVRPPPPTSHNTYLNLPTSTIIFSALRFNETHKLTTTHDISLTAATVVIWQAVQLSYSLAAATIAALKRFTESLNTGFGHGELMRVHGTSQAYKMSDRSGSSKNTKESRSSSKRRHHFDVTVDSVGTDTSQSSVLPPPRKGGISAQKYAMKLRPEALQNTAVVSAQPKQEDRSVDTTAEDNQRIRQEVQYSVHYDEVPLVRPGAQR